MFAVNAADGVNVAVLVPALYETVPATADPPLVVSVNVELVMVEAFIASENTTEPDVETLTPDAPLAGVTDETVGAVAA